MISFADRNARGDGPRPPRPAAAPDAPRLADALTAARGATALRRTAFDEEFDAALRADGLPADLGAFAAAQPVGEPAEAPLGRYLRWQLRDFVRQRAVWLLPIALFALWTAWYNYDAAEVARGLAQGAAGDGPLRRTEPMIFRELALAGSVLFAGLGSLLATFGIVAGERERGLQRFLFAKPVGVVRYYLQKLGVALAGQLACSVLLLVAAMLVFARGVPLLEATGIAACLAVLVGGLTFLVSTLVRHDGPIAAALLMASLPVAAAADHGHRWWAQLLAPLLPPAHAVGAFLDDAGIGLFGVGPAGAALWMLGYGIVCIAAGVAVLRRRSITT